MPTQEDLAFGQIAVANNMITQEQLDECLNSQQLLEKMQVKEDLSTILIKKGYLAKDQADIILSMQGRVKENKKIGGYEILSKLGEGGMGMVYKARQINMDRMVALKILSPQFAEDPDYVQRFFREARSAGKLDHPNVVRGIDVGEADGFHYFSMEFVEGQTLKEYLDQVGTMNERASCMVTLQVSKALEHAHEMELIHRDIKPDNIFLSKNNVVKLGDLGLAKPKGDLSLTQVGVPVGTPCYIAPEQVMNEGNVDIRCDIYSLGVTLYQMLTGTVPDQESSITDAMIKRAQGELPDITTHKPNLSREIVYVVRKMTRKNPAERFLDPTELINELTMFLRGAKLSPDESQLMPLDQAGGGRSLPRDMRGATAPLPAQKPPQQDNFNTAAFLADLPQEEPSMEEIGDTSSLLAYSPGQGLDDDEPTEEDLPLEGLSATPGPISQHNEATKPRGIQVQPMDQNNAHEESSLDLQMEASSSVMNVQSEVQKPDLSEVDINFDQEASVTTKPMVPVAPNSPTPQQKGPGKFPKKKGKKGAISDKLSAKGKGDKKQISDRLSKIKGKKASEKFQKVTDRYPHKKSSKGGLFMVIFILLIGGGVAGAYFAFPEKFAALTGQKDGDKETAKKDKDKKDKGKDKKDGTEKDGTGKDSDKKPPKSSVEEEFQQLQAQAMLYKNSPERLKSLLESITRFRERHPKKLKSNVDKFEGEVKSKWEEEARKEYRKIQSHLKGNFLNQSMYAKAAEKGRSMFPPHFNGTQAHESMLMYTRDLKDKALNEFRELKERSQALARVNKFDEAIGEIKKAENFGYPTITSEVKSTIDSIEKTRRDYQAKIRNQKAREALKLRYEVFKLYHRGSKYYRELIDARNFTSALQSNDRALYEVEPRVKSWIKKDRRYIKKIEKFYKKAKNNVSILVANGQSITVQVGSKVLSGQVKEFSQDTYYIQQGGKQEFLRFKFIPPHQLNSVFARVKTTTPQPDKLAAGALELFEGDYQRAKKTLADLQDQGVDVDYLLELNTLFQTHIQEKKTSRLYFQMKGDEQKGDWNSVLRRCELLLSSSNAGTFFMETYQSEVRQLKEKAEEKLQKNPVNMNYLLGRNIDLHTDKDLSDWKTDSDAWWPKGDGLIYGLKRGSWIIKTHHKATIRGRSDTYPLYRLKHYRFYFKLQVPKWSRVKDKFLSVYLPHQQEVYEVVLAKSGCYLVGAEKKKLPITGLRSWKTFRFVVEKATGNTHPHIAFYYQSRRLGAFSLKDIKPVRPPKNNKGLGFKILCSRSESEVEISQIKMYGIK